MKKILRKHTRAEICEICGVKLRTVQNWIKTENIPLKHIRALGFDIDSAGCILDTTALQNKLKEAQDIVAQTG